VKSTIRLSLDKNSFAKEYTLTSICFSSTQICENRTITGFAYFWYKLSPVAHLTKIDMGECGHFSYHLVLRMWPHQFLVRCAPGYDFTRSQQHQPDLHSVSRLYFNASVKTERI